MRSPSMLLPLLLLAVSSPVAHARPDVMEAHRPGSPSDGLLFTTLDNGLRVLIASTPEAVLAEVDLIESASPLVEPAGQEGIAHLLEHLSFSSSKDFPHGGLGHELALHAVYSNAFTNPWGTEYVVQCLPTFLDSMLRIDAQRLGGLVFESAAFQRERQVVREELAMRTRTGGHGVALAMLRAAYPHHPYGRSSAGTGDRAGEGQGALRGAPRRTGHSSRISSRAAAGPCHGDPGPLGPHGHGGRSGLSPSRRHTA